MYVKDSQTKFCENNIPFSPTRAPIGQFREISTETTTLIKLLPAWNWQLLLSLTVM